MVLRTILFIYFYINFLLTVSQLVNRQSFNIHAICSIINYAKVYEIFRVLILIGIGRLLTPSQPPASIDASW